MIPVTRPYLPDRAKLDKYIDGIYERGWLTNNGPLLRELTARLQDYLGVEHLLLVGNGTLALQIAYRALGITASAAASERPEAVTTPFTFVATASSLKWEGVEPVFADIDPQTWCLDPANLEAAISPHTKAIVPVHVFSNACDVEAIDAIARRRGVKVVYDGAHAFGVKYRGTSLLSYGDAATLSFHATKLFHSVEGGAIVFRHKEDLDRATQLINFGIAGPDRIETLGINAKMNEFQAAMGLCMLDEIEQNLTARAAVWQQYQEALRDDYQLQARNEAATNNYAYAPLLLESEDELEQVLAALEQVGVSARRYFYPSLDTLDFLSHAGAQALHSNDIARRILCLPIYAGLQPDEIDLITRTLKGVRGS